MPKLTPECMEAVAIYHRVVFSHLSGQERKNRQGKVVRLLKRNGKEAQDEYLAKVKDFCEKNAHLVEVIKNDRNGKQRTG